MIFGNNIYNPIFWPDNNTSPEHRFWGWDKENPPCNLDGDCVMVTCFKPPFWGGANRLRQGYQLELGIFSVFSQHSFFVCHVRCSPWIILSGFKAIWTWPEACTWNSFLATMIHSRRPRLCNKIPLWPMDDWHSTVFYSISCSKLGDIPWNLALNRP